MAAITILVDDKIDPEKVAKFLAEISAIYSYLSGGDELIIQAGSQAMTAQVILDALEDCGVKVDNSGFRVVTAPGGPPLDITDG